MDEELARDLEEIKALRETTSDLEINPDLVRRQSGIWCPECHERAGYNLETAGWSVKPSAYCGHRPRPCTVVLCACGTKLAAHGASGTVLAEMRDMKSDRLPKWKY